MHIKIADFGSAKLLSDTGFNQTSGKENRLWKNDRFLIYILVYILFLGSARSFVGTAQYVAPELLRSDPTSKE
jgi:serine/threonine protein kinase